MTIRSRLLLLLLPPLIAFLILISYFFYFNWSGEILNVFKSRLQSIVITTSQFISPKDITWIAQHIHEPDTGNQEIYQNYLKQFTSLIQKLPIVNLYLVQIQSVLEGEHVLPDAVEHPSNEVYKGQEEQNAFRQVLLLKVTKTKNESPNKPGEYDFSETDEQQVYLTKKAFVTPIYETRKTKERLISAYAPILNEQGEVVALLGADVGIWEIDQKLWKAWLSF